MGAVQLEYLTANIGRKIKRVNRDVNELPSKIIGLSYCEDCGYMVWDVVHSDGEEATIPAETDLEDSGWTYMV
jgi:hypothetical protein